jgi:hypothetical protein
VEEGAALGWPFPLPGGEGQDEGEDGSSPLRGGRISSQAAIKAGAPTLVSFRRLNSSPSENMSRMTPSSARVFMVSRSWMSGNGGVCGPMMILPRN